jgi:type I restriction enzyme S subunit
LSATTACLGEILHINTRSLNPAIHPDRVFHLFSIPGFDNERKPEYVTGNQIGSNKYQLASECILVSKINPRIKRIWRVTNPMLNRSVCSTEFIQLIPKRIDIDLRFIEHFLIHTDLERLTATASQAATKSRQRFLPSAILSIPISLPSVAEQRRIVGLLDRAAEIRRRAEAARAKARVIIPALFLDTFGDPATNPKGWPEVHLAAQLLSPLSYGSMTSPKADEAGWRDIRVANIRGGLIDHTDTKYVELAAALIGKHTLRDGDIVLARAIGSEQHLGKCALVFPGTERWAYDSHIMRIRLDPDRVSPFWLHALMNTDGGKKRLLRRSRASAIQHNINTKEVAAFYFGLPHLTFKPSLQSRFSASNHWPAISTRPLPRPRRWPLPSRPKCSRQGAAGTPLRKRPNYERQINRFQETDKRRVFLSLKVMLWSALFV